MKVLFCKRAGQGMEGGGEERRGEGRGRGGENRGGEGEGDGRHTAFPQSIK